MNGDGTGAAFVVPQWASESLLLRVQVRDLTQYAMFVFDTDGIILSWNAGVQHILGYSEAEWVGQHASVIFTDADNSQDVCSAEMKKAAEQGFSSDVRWHKRKDGSELFGQGCMSALRNEGGELIGYSKIFSDETKNKQLQDSLTESNAALEQFAYVASHDLQEPLRTLSTHTEVLLRRYADQVNDEARAILDRIKKASQRMSALVHDLLAYARTQTEVDRPASDSLDQVLETAMSSLKASIDESSAVITHDPLPEIEADHGQMVRLFQNLLGNAIKYRKPDVAPKIHVSASRSEAGEWIVVVADNGIGFDPKYAQEIFAPFKRLHSHETLEGNGIGLAICRRIVETHHGRIWAESAVGEGAKFFVLLPAGGKAPAHRTRSVIAGFDPPPNTAQQ